MTPEIYEGDYVQIESDEAGCTMVPADCFIAGDVADDECTQNMCGILIRLSASGYLDCTEWEPMDSWADVIDRLQEWVDESND